MQKYRKHLSFANVTSLLALLVALSGSAYAIGKHTVGTKQLKPNAVTSPKVKNGSLLETDFAPGQLPGPTNVTVRSAYTASGTTVASCLPGEVATGGGAGVDNYTEQYVGRSEPSPPKGVPTGWSAYLRNLAGGTAGSGTVYVVCASP